MNAMPPLTMSAYYVWTNNQLKERTALAERWEYAVQRDGQWCSIVRGARWKGRMETLAVMAAVVGVICAIQVVLTW